MKPKRTAMLALALFWVGLTLAGVGVARAAEGSRTERGTKLQGDPLNAVRAGLEQALTVGNELLELNQPEDALQRFRAAAVMAVQAGTDADLTYVLYRTGIAHRDLYLRTGDVEHIKSAIAYWEHERTLYGWHGYPPGFRALAGYDLGQAYLSLARHEGLVENGNRGLAIFSESLKTFGTAVVSYQAALKPVNGGPEYP